MWSLMGGQTWDIICGPQWGVTCGTSHVVADGGVKHGMSHVDWGRAGTLVAGGGGGGTECERVAKKGRSHRDLNSDRWIQSPEC